MMISKATVRTLAVPLSIPYTIAYETITDVTNHFLIIQTDAGETGIGCAAPAFGVTGETNEMSRLALNQIAKDIIGCAPSDVLLNTYAATPSAQTALDLALADLLSKSQDLSVGEWLKGSKARFQPVVTSVTIGIMNVEETLQRAQALFQEGFTFLKIKGGHDIGVDLERLQALHEELGEKCWIALDANQGYSVQDVAALEAVASSLDLKYLEQPTPKDDLNLLRAATESTSIPVMADESVQTIEDAKRIVDGQSAALINIKLQKMGGLAAAIKIDQIALDGGVRTMLGCMDESALSIAAALHFGAARPNVQYYDLDGHLDLLEDPFESLVSLSDGKLNVKRSKGLGIADDVETLWSE